MTDPAAPHGRRPGAADPRVGSILLGKYRIEELLGQGGSGRVYRATHMLLKASVAVKFLLAAWAQQEVFRARFDREARVLAHLCHPGIAAAHDYGEDSGELYLIMEHVAGTQLGRVLAEHRLGVPIPRVVSIIEQVLDVLCAAHASGIVHRDIKPANLMLYRDNAGMERLKLLDFGLALMDDPSCQKRLTRNDQVVGTAHYMSPEQCLGHVVGPPADIYALGVLLYQMLSGHLPFRGDTPAKVLEHHLNDPPPPIKQLGPFREVPPQLSELAMWAMSKSAVARPTAAQLRQALWRAMETSRRVLRTSMSIAPVLACQLPPVVSSIPSRDDNPITVEAVVMQSGTLNAVIMPRVALWGYKEPQVEKLVEAMWPHKLHGVPWSEAKPPPDRLAGHPVSAILLPDDVHTLERLGGLRSEGPHRKTPVMITDVADTTSVIGLIRGGASDMVLRDTDDEHLCNQLVRLVRRRR